jgi:tryptophan synthase alpha chain
VSPQTSEKRIQEIDSLTRGFIYLVSSYSITGGAASFEAYQQAYFERINTMNLQHPTMIGFGISHKAGVENAFHYSNGAIIGSAFIKALQQPGSLEENIHSFIQKVQPS